MNKKQLREEASFTKGRIIVPGKLVTRGKAKRGAIEQDLQLGEFPSPATLWARYRVWKGLPPEADPIVLQDYYDDASGRDRGITRPAR